MLAILDGNSEFAALEQQLRNLKSFIETTPEADAHETVNQLSKAFGKVEGAGDVKSALSKARRALKDKRNPDREKALVQYEKAVAAYEEQVKWRSEAETVLRPKLNAYLEAIRSQERLNREQALFMAGCNAKHRDISLNF